MIICVEGERKGDGKEKVRIKQKQKHWDRSNYSNYFVNILGGMGALFSVFVPS